MRGSPDPERAWLFAEPMPRAVVDPALCEVRVRASMGPGGRVTGADALIRRVPDGRAEPAMVLAWARRPDMDAKGSWCVLAVWMDSVNATTEGGSGRIFAWRGGWMEYMPELLESVEPWRQTSE